MPEYRNIQLVTFKSSSVIIINTDKKTARKAPMLFKDFISIEGCRTKNELLPENIHVRNQKF
jgi:hypothetical protein